MLGYPVSLKIERLDEGVYQDVARKLIEMHIGQRDLLPEAGGVERKKVS